MIAGRLRCVAFAVSLLFALPVHAALIVNGGTITGAATWTLADSPVTVTADVVVAAGASLTIEPGVTVRFEQFDGLLVHGTLTAAGTEDLPIVLTALDPAKTWGGVQVQGTQADPSAQAVLEHVTLEYGGTDGDGVLHVGYGSATVSGSILRNLTGASPNHGLVVVAGGNVAVSDSAFTGLAGTAIEIRDGGTAPALSGLTVSGNGLDAVAFGGGTITGARRFPALGVPYVIRGDLTVAAGSGLTIDPGVTVKFEQFHGLLVHGTLTAAGTAALPIVLTALDPAKTWGGVQVQGTQADPTAHALLDHVTVEYGGADAGAVLQVGYGSATVSGSILRNLTGQIPNAGITVGVGGNVAVRNTSLTGLAGTAIEIRDGGTAPALSGLTVSGNGLDAVAFGGGTITGARRFPALGVPYVIRGDLTVAAGSGLTIDPGVTVKFEQFHGLLVHGTLTAIGTAAQPIVLTALVPGVYWGGLQVKGTQADPAARAVLEHVTMEYGGTDADASVAVTYGAARISNAVIRQNRGDAIFVQFAGSTLVERSQLIEVADGHYAVRNAGGGTVQAPNDWWGHVNGPTEGTCNPSGSGTAVVGAVAYRPFLTSPTGEPGPAAPLGTSVVSLAPLRWFAPADGIARIWVKVKVVDGAGLPLIGRTVHLTSTLGQVVDGSTTDATGEALAYLTSTTAGEAVLGSTLTLAGACEVARVASAKVSFTTAADDLLLPDAQAPYMTDRLDLGPLPIVQGAPSFARAHFKNPNAFAITVDATLEVAQRGIGMAFGPLGSRTVEIAAGAEGTVEVAWVPPLSGHYCVQLQYAARPTASGRLDWQARAAGSAWSGSKQKNLDAKAAELLSQQEKDAIEKGKESAHALELGVEIMRLVLEFKEGLAHSIGTYIPSKLFGGILEFNFTTWRAASEALGGAETTSKSVPSWWEKGKRWDQPTQRRRVELPTYEERLAAALPTQATEAEALVRAAVEASLDLEALVVAQLRYQGATEAGSQVWAAQHAAEVVLFRRQLAPSCLALSQALSDYLAGQRARGFPVAVVTEAEAADLLARLAGAGFDATELEAAAVLGLTAADVEAHRLHLLSFTAAQLAGDKMALFEAFAVAMRNLSWVLAGADNFGGSASGQIPGGRFSDGALALAASGGGHLVRTHQANTSFQVRNPLAQAATIELAVRPLDVPPDWEVGLSRTSLDLAAGESATVTATIRPLTAEPQGSVRRLAVEGWSGGQLVGGVVTDVVAPYQATIDAACDATAQKAEGAACACDQECAEGQGCALADGTTRCLPLCDPAATSATCGTGRTCTDWRGATGVCALAAVGPGGGGGASTGGCGCGQADGSLVALLALLGPWLRRLRAPRPAPGSPSS